MSYLFWAYAVIWILIFGYLARITTRQNRLNRDIEMLRQTLEERPAE
jgi:CcmD family protein